MIVVARLRSVLLVVTVVALACVAGATSGSQDRPVAAATAGRCPGQIAVVVDFGDGQLRVDCAAPGGSGIDVLRRAGYSLSTYGFTSVGGDAAVCAISVPGGGPQVGCATGPDCLKCQAPDSWQYFPNYRYSQIGAGDTRPGGCTIEAWRWGRSQTWSAARLSFADVCPPEPPPTTAPPATTTPPATTAPSGGTGGTGGTGGAGGSGGGSTNPQAGDAQPGPGGEVDPPSGRGATSGPSATDPTTTAPDEGSTTTTTTPDGSTTSTTEPGDDAEPSGARGRTADDGRSGSPDDERAEGAAPISSSGPGGGGGGAPIGSFVVAALVVAAVGALALRARRRRASPPSARA